uniref:Small ribosomal subunit protein uS3c n=1 Tax=Rhipiliopsis peltata TaxID=2320810 RepID=A0A386B1A2_9CHLO|nr:ribosomal protein S3 [Rhipiliopsis peltata]AYC65476.1 ribosomal protein S3 [Rhipiliopsis peltata]
MGQKVHPVGLRLGITQPHLSQWFASKKNYSKYLFEDYFLRKTLLQRYRNAGFEKIKILRKIENHLEITIHVEKPSILVGNKGEDLAVFQQEIKRILQKYQPSQNEKKVVLYVLGSSPTSASASSMADFLIDLLEKRIPYRIALKLLFQQLPRKKFQKGLKIQISGRLNGAEIARRHWVREGRLPLQTLDAHIDYCLKTAQTIYGILGIKVWVFSDEKET